MHFLYIDDSTDRPLNVFSALCVPEETWNKTFDGLRVWRKFLRDVHGIPTGFELHATEFLSGRGSGGKLAELSRHRRAQIFHRSFRVTEWLHRDFGASLFNVANTSDDQFQAFERLLNRVNRTMEKRGSFCHLICDEGKEDHYIRLVRKMKVYNPIPSKYGGWSPGQASKNIPLDRVIEDPQFKSSRESFFIQHVDFMAYGLLRSERPTPKAKKHGIHRSFNQLNECLERVCNPSDHRKMGIIR